MLRKCSACPLGERRLLQQNPTYRILNFTAKRSIPSPHHHNYSDTLLELFRLLRRRGLPAVRSAPGAFWPRSP